MLSRKKKSSPRLHPSIRRDAVNPRDYLQMKLMYACEDCSHFSKESEQCSLGYNAENHRKAHLENLFQVSGTMTLCRFHEID